MSEDKPVYTVEGPYEEADFGLVFPRLTSEQAARLRDILRDAKPGGTFSAHIQTPDGRTWRFSGVPLEELERRASPDHIVTVNMLEDTGEDERVRIGRVRSGPHVAFESDGGAVNAGLPLAALERQNALDNIRGALRQVREDVEGMADRAPAGAWDGASRYVSRADVLAAIDRKIEELE